MTARKPLCPRTLWWGARQADKERPALPMGVYEQAFAAALRHVARVCRRRSREIGAIEKRRTKKGRKP